MNKIIATDCDGVLLLWEKHFDKWMESQEFTKFAKDHYSIDMNYHLGEGQSKVLIKVFNESAWMRDIEPVEGSVEIVKKLSEQGYKFDVITSQTLDTKAQQLRRENLINVFGDVFNEITFLDMGAGKREVLDQRMKLKQYKPGTFWIEDKPNNAEDGASLDLKSLLFDLPHNRWYNSKVTPVQRVSGWSEIYNVIIKENKNHE